MKKKILIPLILSFFLFKAVYCQENDSMPHIKWSSLNLYVSSLPGYEIINRDSATVTIASMIGANYRIYSKKTMKTFFDFDLNAMPIIINGSKFTSFLYGDIGFGVIRSNYNWQFHLSYAHSFLKYPHMYGCGYYIEAQSIPISIEFLRTFKGKRNLFLIGVKVPITSF